MDFKIDLHGMRVHEALSAVERHLQRCYSGRVHVAHINHGHGTGALRQAVNELLAGHQLVAHHYPASYGDGGDGVTIAELNYGQGKPLRRRFHDTLPVQPSDRRR
ncbi:MAG: Smr/MutS family protein [Dehalococcoidia bacterium]